MLDHLLGIDGFSLCKNVRSFTAAPLPKRRAGQNASSHNPIFSDELKGASVQERRPPSYDAPFKRLSS